MNKLFDEVTLSPFIETEIISNALTTDNPNLKTEVSTCCCSFCILWLKYTHVRAHTQLRLYLFILVTSLA